MRLYINFGVLTRLGYEEEKVLRVSWGLSVSYLAKGVADTMICIRAVPGGDRREGGVGGRPGLGEHRHGLLLKSEI